MKILNSKDAATAIATWSTLPEIDQELIVRFRSLAIREALNDIHRKDGSPLLRMVVEAAQSGVLSIHVETADSFMGYVSRFRKECNWHANHSDTELQESIGLWHFQSFGHGCAEFSSPSYSRLVADAEYKLWNLLDDIPYGMDSYHNATALAAVLNFEKSEEFIQFPKAADFEIRLFDANSAEWGANSWLTEKRNKNLA